MKLYWKMPKGLKPHYQEELFLSKDFLKKNDFQNSWHHLERAHVIGQPFAVEHTQAHWRMLLFAFRIKNTKEIVGQVPRLLVGGVKSYVGKIPTGNTGGSNIPPLKKMELPPDIEELLKLYR